MTPQELADMLREHFRLDVQVSRGSVRVELRLKDEKSPNDMYFEQVVLSGEDSQ